MRRTFIAAANVALLAIPLFGAVASAAPSCDGRPATIVGTNASEDIQGTNGRDVIVAKGGDDHIDGRAGSDIICGGEGVDLIRGGLGNDRIFGGGDGDAILGGGGRDRIFGHEGADTISGGPGNDIIDGGPAIDRCFQDAGSGAIRNCERADLSVDVDCPEEGTEGLVTCQVDVTNHGPDASWYDLDIEEVTGDGGDLQCFASGWDEDELNDRPKLAPGRTRSEEMGLQCTGGGAQNTLEVEVLAGAKDPVSANNFDQDAIDFP